MAASNPPSAAATARTLSGTQPPKRNVQAAFEGKWISDSFTQERKHSMHNKFTFFSSMWLGFI